MSQVPAAEAASAAGNSPNYRVTSSNRVADARILLVDDSPLMLTVIARHLRNYGFTNISEAADGREALAIALEWRPDIVLTDLIMPNMDGFELCQRLRGHASFKDIPILVLTGMDKSDDRSAVFSAGATDLITKPIDRLELIGRIRVHLDHLYLIKRLSEFQKNMDQELRLARSMQESLLPSKEVIAEIEAAYPVAIGSHYEASQGLGGDLWGLVPLENGKLKVYSADFSGHGVGSALNTFRLHTFMSSGTRQAESPAAWMAQLNEYLCSVLPIGQFATMFCAVIDFEAGEVVHVSAGVPSQLLSGSTAHEPFHLIDGTGYPLGLIEEATYQEVRSRFAPGSGLIMYSDALIETPDPPRQVFTPEGLAEFVNLNGRGVDCRRIPSEIVAYLQSKAKQKPDDDLTIISLFHRNVDPGGDHLQSVDGEVS